jgi:aldehyde dehydrogenase (NAD+)
MQFHSLLINQKNYFKTGATRSLEFRLSQLERLKQAIKTHEAQILQALYKDLHKAKEEAYITEIGVLYEEIEIAKKNLRNWMAPVNVKTPLVLWPGKAQVIKEPLGSVCIFSPWNYPFQLLLAPLIGAIASGNCAVLKPAHLTSHTQKVTLEIIQKTFDPNYIAAIGGDLKECEELLKENFDFIFFTGSPRVGRIIMAAAAQHLTPVCLELGGKSPAIVDVDAKIDIAAKRICWAKFLNAGQTCVAPDYTYVHKSIKNEFLKKCKEVIIQFYGENPQQSASFGRIVNLDHFDRLKNLLHNEEIYHGGESIREERYIAPTILSSIEWGSKVMEGEIFGPIMPILEYEDLNQVKDEILNRNKPLALYIFSTSKKIQQELVRDISSGAVCINDCVVHVGNPYLPFGGVGESGMGAYHGKKSFDIMSHHKALQASSHNIDPPLRYPPYTDNKLKWIKRFLG